MCSIFSNIAYFVLGLFAKILSFFLTLLGIRRTKQQPQTNSHAEDNFPDDIPLDEMPSPIVSPLLSPIHNMPPTTDDSPTPTPMPSSTSEADGLLRTRAEALFEPQLPAGGNVTYTEDVQMFEELIAAEDRNVEELGESDHGMSTVLGVQGSIAERIELVGEVDVPEPTPVPKRTDGKISALKARAKAKMKAIPTLLPKRKLRVQEEDIPGEEVEEVVFLDGFVLDSANRDHIEFGEAPTGYTFREKRLRVKKRDWETYDDASKFDAAKYGYEY